MYRKTLCQCNSMAPNLKSFLAKCPSNTQVSGASSFLQGPVSIPGGDVSVQRKSLIAVCEKINQTMVYLFHRLPPGNKKHQCSMQATESIPRESPSEQSQSP